MSLSWFAATLAAGGSVHGSAGLCGSTSLASVRTTSSPRIAAEVEIRRHARCEVLAACGSRSAGRIERENAKTRGIDRASRTRVAQVCDIGDGAAAFEQGALEIDPQIHFCLWLSGHGRGPSGDCLPADQACTLKSQLRDATRTECVVPLQPPPPIWTEPTL